MRIKNARIKNAHVIAQPLEIVSGARFNATSLNNWAGVTASGSPGPVLREGKYLEFNGTQGLVTDNIDTNTLTNNDYTYEFWVRTTGTNTGALLTKFGYGGYQISAVEVATVTLVPGYYVGSQAYLPVDTPITRDVWQHYTVTYNTSDGHLRTYYNGQLVATMTLGTELSPRDFGINPMYFTLFSGSGYGFGYSGALTGDFGEFRLYTRALTDAEVSQNYRATRSRWQPAPTGLTSADPSTSAWQIKQDYPDSTDGLYWIQNANINSGNPVQIYADMTTLGGGWTLLVQNNLLSGWDNSTTLLRNSTTPPSVQLDYTSNQSDSNNYSILGWADYIKKTASAGEATFDYMVDAAYRGRNGGAWTANEDYSFVATYDSSSYGNQMLLGRTASVYPGQSAVTGDTGFRKNITEITKFNVGAPGETATWEYGYENIEGRMPYVGTAGGYIPGGNMLLGTDSDSAWWGTIISLGSVFDPAPWMGTNVSGLATNVYPNPKVIWYWVR
jgi:hypothetical protein